MALLSKKELEKLLSSQWIKFLNTSEIIKYIQENVNIKKKEFKSVPGEMPQGTEYSISNFEITKYGFLIWMEFNMPAELVAGTLSLLLSHEGSLLYSDISGVVYTASSLR